MENRNNLRRVAILMITFAVIIIVLQIASNIMYKHYLVRFSGNQDILVLMYSIMGSIKTSAISVMAAIFGPIIGLTLSLIERVIGIFGRRNMINLEYYLQNLFNFETLSFLLYGISIGALWKCFNFGKKGLKIKSVTLFIICQFFVDTYI